MIQPDEHQHHTIWTPELVELSLPLAGIARRCLAMLIDQIIMAFVVISTCILLIVGLFSTSIIKSYDFTGETFIIMGIICMVLLTMAAYFCYFWLMHTFNRGKTLGKMVTGIRLVTDRGGRAGIWTCLIRSIVDLLDLVLFYYGVAAIMILATEREKRFADIAAGTIVILDR